MGLLDDYFALQRQYQAKNGPDTVVFMQKGQFYEVYQYIPSLEGKHPGSRFEIIEHLSSNPDPDAVGAAVDMSFILGIVLTSSNKNLPHSYTNPLMAGMPVANYEDRRDIALAHGFTIVRVDEMGKAKSKGQLVPREVVEVASLATEMNTLPVVKQQTNRVASIYIQYQKSTKTRNINNLKPSDFMVCVGMASLDVSTGQSWVCEVYSEADNAVHAIQEIYRFLTSHRPRELLIDVDKLPQEDEARYEDYLYKDLDLMRHDKVIIRFNTIDKELQKLHYQCTFLEKVFHSTPTAVAAVKSGPGKDLLGVCPSNNGMVLSLISADGSSSVLPTPQQSGTVVNLSILEELDLERYLYGVQAYVLLLQHCYEHNELIIQRVQKPESAWSDQVDHLVPTHNAIDQIELLPPEDGGAYVKLRRKIVNSLLSVVDQCATKMGSRLVRTMILRPLTNVELLNRYYLMTEALVPNSTFDDSLLKQLRQLLRTLPDIERLNRKLSLSMISPRELYKLIMAYNTTSQLQGLLYSCGPGSPLYGAMMDGATIQEFNACLQYLYQTYDVEELAKIKLVKGYDKVDMSEAVEKATDDVNATYIKTILHPGVAPEVEQLMSSLVSYRRTVQQMVDYLNQFLQGGRTKLLSLTYTRKIKPSSNDDKPDLGRMLVCITASTAGVKKLKTASTNGSIDANYLGQMTFTNKTKTVSYVSSTTMQQYLDAIVDTQERLELLLYMKYQQLMYQLNAYSFHHTLAKFCAFLDYIHNSAWCAHKYNFCKPTIDDSKDNSFVQATALRHQLVQELSTVPYVPNDVTLGLPDSKGILLYGVNATGKTTYAKSVGLAVIMAQAGMFVPATSFVYKPYTKVMTRLSGNDSLLTGKSSFAVEMLELRTILRQADERTLVLGDELCRGTETESGTSITVAAIVWLMRTHSSFIFSTHMHHLMEVKEIQTLMTKGLNVCHLSVTYDASSNLLIYDRTIGQGSGSSVYGLEVCRSLDMPTEFITMADTIRREVCGLNEHVLSTKKSRYNAKIYVDTCSLCGSNFQLQTHHLVEQQTADERGFVGHYHKNAAYNLVVLCESCHQQLHQMKLSMTRQQTSVGPITTISN